MYITAIRYVARFVGAVARFRREIPGEPIGVWRTGPLTP
jgi:hypothetical protein